MMAVLAVVMVLMVVVVVMLVVLNLAFLTKEGKGHQIQLTETANVAKMRITACE